MDETKQGWVIFTGIPAENAWEMANSINEALEDKLQVTEEMRKELEEANNRNSRKIDMAIQCMDLEVGYLEFREIKTPEGQTFKIGMQRAPFSLEEATEVMTITATSNGFMNEFIEDMQRTLIAEIPEMTEEDIFLKVGKVAIEDSLL